MFRFLSYFVYVPTLLASYGFKDLLPLGLPLSEGPSNPFTRHDSEKFCPQYDLGVVWGNDHVVNRSGVPGEMQQFHDGFFKSTCFPDTAKYDDIGELCIFLHPTVNHGKGMVIIAPEKALKESFESGLDLWTEPLDPEAMEVVKVPEKGGMGAVAAHTLQMGEAILLERPVFICPYLDSLWWTDYGMNMRRQAIDHLPIHTRAAIARLHGIVSTEDQFLSDVINKNTFLTVLSGDPDQQYAALVLDGSRINHACRPNANYYIHPHTQLFYVNAVESIEAGAEISVSYKHLEMLGDERREDLESGYGFNCTCSYCQMSKEEATLSNQRVKRIQALLDQVTHSVEEIHETLELCEIEKIPSCTMQAHLIVAALHNWEGETGKVKEHAQAAMNLGMILAGPDWVSFDEANLLLNTPEKHHSHFSLQTQRDHLEIKD